MDLLPLELRPHRRLGRWVIKVFEPVYLQILFRSLAFAVLTVLLTLILCYPVAVWVSRLPDRWRRGYYGVGGKRDGHRRRRADRQACGPCLPGT